MSSKVNVGLIQMRCFEDRAHNLEAALAYVREAADGGADIVCLPELFMGRYFCQTESYTPFDQAEPIPGPTTAVFEKLARELDVVIILSLFEERTTGLYHNSAAVLDGPNGYIGKYRKMHIPDDPRYYEKFYFAPGDLGFKSFQSTKGNLGILICWDQWYPEAARLTVLKGAEILFYPTAIGWHPEEKASHGKEQHAAWELMQRSHAVANGCFVVSVNRTGFEPTPTEAAVGAEEGIEFWGQSFVAAPDGSIINKAPIDGDSVLVVPIDPGRIRAARTGWPFLRDRRTDAYEGITKRFDDE